MSGFKVNIKAKCDECMYHSRKGKCIYCTLNHYFPRKEMIAFHGCSDYKCENIDLLNWNKEVDDEQEKDNDSISVSPNRISE